MMPYVGLARHWTEPMYQWGVIDHRGAACPNPPNKIKMAYTPVQTRPNTPGIQKLPTGRFSAPFSRRAHDGMIMVIIEELWWGVGCPVRPGRVGTVEERAVGGWRACLERHVSPTTKHDHLPRVPPPHYWSVVCNGETGFYCIARELPSLENRDARLLLRAQAHRPCSPCQGAHVHSGWTRLCHRTGALLPRRHRAASRTLTPLSPRTTCAS